MNIGKYSCYMVRERTSLPQESMSNPETTYKLLKDKLHTIESPCEELYALYLNSQFKITGYELISRSGLISTNCHPREVFRGAILNNARAIILTHNHPSGDITPSQYDARLIFGQ